MKCEVESLTPKETRRPVLNKEKMRQPKNQITFLRVIPAMTCQDVYLDIY